MTPRRIGWFLSLQDVLLTTTAHIATDDAILGVINQQLAGYGVGQVSNDLIIKSFDTGFQLCLIIKELDNQDQKLNYQINQYPKKSLIVSLDVW